jgi:hypothetical protein
MTQPPHTPNQGTEALLPSRRGRAVIAFFGIWLIGSGITLLFAHHKHNPFDAFTTKVPLVGVPVVIGAYAALLACAWVAIPRFKSEFINELGWNGVTIVGGMFAPHLLSFLFGLFA